MTSLRRAPVSVSLLAAGLALAVTVGCSRGGNASGSGGQAATGGAISAGGSGEMGTGGGLNGSGGRPGTGGMGAAGGVTGMGGTGTSVGDASATGGAGASVGTGGVGGGSAISGAGGVAPGTGGRGGTGGTGSGGVSTSATQDSGATGGTVSSGGRGGTGGTSGGTAGTGYGGTGGTSGGTAGTGRGGTGGGGMGGASSGQSLEDLQRAYVELRFGMFIHFGILTYTGSWAQGNLPIDMFNPASLDPSQWAVAAASAKMKFGVLTTKHHDGFALWPSSVGKFDVGNISWRGGKGDVVREYVDAFRAKGLLPGLYYSMFDATQGIADASTITPQKIDFAKTQIRELLTNYGDIPVLFVDGWAWKMGHLAVPYQEIRDLVKSLQPNCLLADNTHLGAPWEVDVVNFEEPQGVFAPVGNTYAAHQEQKINASGGNDWFWAPGIGNLMSVSSIVDGHLAKLEPIWTNFILNCPPNRDGLLDASIVSRLAEVGAAWSPNPSRPPLPAQGAQIERPYSPVAATSTSGTARNAIDGFNDNNFNTLWQSAGALPQSVTIDLGQTRPDVGIMSVTPKFASNVGVTDGNITSYRILLGTDGSTFNEATTGTWPADGRLKIAAFSPTAARYVRLEARAANGSSAIVTEISVGAR